MPRRLIGWSGSLPRSDWLPRTPSRAGAWRERRFAEEQAGRCERRSVCLKRSLRRRRIMLLALVGFIVSVSAEFLLSGLLWACLGQPPLCVGPAGAVKSLSPDERQLSSRFSWHPRVCGYKRAKGKPAARLSSNTAHLSIGGQAGSAEDVWCE